MQISAVDLIVWQLPGSSVTYWKDNRDEKEREREREREREKERRRVRERESRRAETPCPIKQLIPPSLQPCHSSLGPASQSLRDVLLFFPSFCVSTAGRGNSLTQSPQGKVKTVERAVNHSSGTSQNRDRDG